MGEPLSKRIGVGDTLPHGRRVVAREPMAGVPGWSWEHDDGSRGWVADEYIDEFPEEFEGAVAEAGL